MEVLALYLPKIYNFTFTLPQYAILFLFNEHEALTYEAIQKITEIPKESLNFHLRQMLSQTISNSLILKQNTKTPTCTDKEILRLNPDFVSIYLKKSFVPINTKKVTKKDEKVDEAQNVIKERIFATEAAIMKIMKVS